MDLEDQKSLDDMCNICLDIVNKQYIITKCDHVLQSMYCKMA